ncbi:PAP2 family protein [Arenibacter sp. TNZ]|jgi:membrane-associated phospholipid phosphatase|uniref:phosphatase PAP2 family protein n=1 Tax=Arenibacter TaxID=178469 RepID=UPI000CD42B07|nr:MULTISPECIES: phosphatase PAP2 family protein [Arenibacter]MCM4172070.1 PAP2 family protein [Arenibacter sp. TNZ]
MGKRCINIICVFLILSIKSYSQDTEGGHEKWEYVLEDTGDVLQLALPITAGIMTLIHKDYEGTKKLAFSYGTTLALTYSLKHITKKKRPEGRNLYDSFPSGHTSSAFSGASFIQRRYGWSYGIPAYILASLVAVSRTEAPDGFHDFWDVFAGAAIGIGSTYIFTKPYKSEQMSLGFANYRNTYSLTFTYQF